MSSLKELEQRVTVLEDRMDVESGLRASADRDLGDIAQTLRAQQRTIQALAITQSEHTAILGRLTAKLDEHTAILGQHTAKLDEHTAKLDEHTAKLDEHTAILGQHGASLTSAHGKLDQIITMLDQLAA